MDEKLKPIANQIMELFQEKGLTCKEVWEIILSLEGRVSSQRRLAVDALPFTSDPF